MMSGARGCFNCGGCAWCFRVVRLALPPMTFVVVDKDHVYLANPPTLPFILSTSSSFICVLSGADVDRRFLFCFPYRTDDQCDRQKKPNAPKNLIIIIMIVLMME